MPVNYPIPSDGPVGAMLKATGRHPWRPAHIHFVVSADGYEPVTTHIFDRRDPYLESDAVFAVKDSLICDFTRHENGDGKRHRRPVFTPPSSISAWRRPETTASRCRGRAAPARRARRRA